MEILIERANELGIETKYADKNLDKVPFKELAEAIKVLSWNITAVEEMGSGPSIWADENK